ncbi:DDX58 [Mytilus edulis]|uniref:DDX58 n=1 Tax=Mytilus edulis TaxID=6550 RepID=A0A8S3SR51_MYTED|nr:DDX58 [Mytilus edulis]
MKKNRLLWVCFPLYLLWNCTEQCEWKSWHASCALKGNRIMIHGGYDGDLALDDLHIFTLATSSWMKIKLEPSPIPRAGHQAICLPYNHENEEQDEVLIFGGGNNDGNFFHDLLSANIPFNPIEDQQCLTNFLPSNLKEQQHQYQELRRQQHEEEEHQRRQQEEDEEDEERRQQEQEEFDEEEELRQQEQDEYDEEEERRQQEEDEERRHEQEEHDEEERRQKEEEEEERRQQQEDDDEEEEQRRQEEEDEKLRQQEDDEEEERRRQQQQDDDEEEERRRQQQQDDDEEEDRQQQIEEEERQLQQQLQDEEERRRQQEDNEEEQRRQQEEDDAEEEERRQQEQEQIQEEEDYYMNYEDDDNIKGEDLTGIHIINILLLGGLLLVLVAVLWRAYLKSRVRCYEHATELVSNQRTTEQPDSTVDDLDGSETFEVHYSVINDSSYIIRPSRDWDLPVGPQPFETSIGDDLERCRRSRNYILHRGNTLFTDQDVNDIFSEFESIAERFEKALHKQPNEFVSEFENLRTCSMDAATEKMYLDNLQDLMKNEKVTLESIQALKIQGTQTEERMFYVEQDLQSLKGKIKIWKADEDDSENFETEMTKARLIFLTPKSLCNHLIETAATKVSIDIFTLIVLDECHHTHDKSVYNELMSYYRIAKYREKTHRLPQILGLTASPDVTKLSVVQRNREELLQYTSIPEKVPIASTTRKLDPLKDILLGAMEYVENKLNSRIVSNFLTENLLNNRDLYEALGNPPVQRTDVRYIQWIGETKEKVEHVLHKDPKVPRLLHACLRHLELYTECLEINSLLEIDQVREIVMQRYADESFASQNANSNEETEIVSKLRGVFAELREIGRNIEGNPDVKNVIERIENEYQLLKEESRFIIFVKARATAKALAERLPSYLRSTHLTGSHKSVEEAGLPAHEQIEVLEKFRNGEHLCIVATSVGCEGLDVPQCNMMIRYRFSADEISSLQMRGMHCSMKSSQKEGREVIVGTSQEFETEKKNIQRQYLMTQAIDEVSKLNITRDIAVAEKMIYEIEEIERRTANMKLNQKERGFLLSIVNTVALSLPMAIQCDKVDRRQIPKKKQREFDGIKKLGKAYGLECGHNWGSIVIYNECEFVALSQDYIKIFDRQADSFINCEKWYDLKFKIEEISDDDFMNYNR